MRSKYLIAGISFIIIGIILYFWANDQIINVKIPDYCLSCNPTKYSPPSDILYIFRGLGPCLIALGIFLPIFGYISETGIIGLLSKNYIKKYWVDHWIERKGETILIIFLIGLIFGLITITLSFLISELLLSLSFIVFIVIFIITFLKITHSFITDFIDRWRKIPVVENDIKKEIQRITQYISFISLTGIFLGFLIFFLIAY